MRVMLGVGIYFNDGICIRNKEAKKRGKRINLFFGVLAIAGIPSKPSTKKYKATPKATQESTR